MEGWIKFYRQVNENEIFRHDRTAWHIFEVLLIQCRYGVWKGGRFQLAEFCDEKPNTIYKALKRLEKAEMVTLSSNNRFTTISILNWDKYQGNGNSIGNTSSNNKVTTKEQQSNTSIRIKNKELRIKNNTTDEILKFLKTQPKIKSPEGYLKYLIGKYGYQHLGRLLKINFNEWKTNLEYWKNNN